MAIIRAMHVSRFRPLMLLNVGGVVIIGIFMDPQAFFTVEGIVLLVYSLATGGVFAFVMAKPRRTRTCWP